jgi:snRNA-activating protein complex subunit 3
VLGENYLTELKDKITCFKNEIRVGEFSQDPDKIKDAPLMKDLIQSSFFFIENVFYNDLRNYNTDCSL